MGRACDLETRIQGRFERKWQFESRNQLFLAISISLLFPIRLSTAERETCLTHSGLSHIPISHF
jgi:hypothetical protein